MSNGTQLTVSATHIYRKAGKYKVKITVTQKAAHVSHVQVAKVLALIVTSAVVS